jgi:crotonobetainyl-CoA:carnitine CoA-transferase CaiB-like acyl-CoA transferase
MPSRPLSKLGLLDLGTFVAAPFCATILGEFGAEVVKIEVRGKGDSLRTLGAECNGVLLFWLQESRNKRTVTCDLREQDGREIIRDFAGNGYNVILENFRPDTLERRGLGHEDLSVMDPALIMGRFSGYGQDGPNKDLPGFGRIAHPFSGLTYLCGFPDGPPANPGSAIIADYLSGLFVAFCVLVADRERASTGRAQIVDVALYESIFGILDSLAITYSGTGAVRERMGTGTALAAPHNHYQTNDRWVAIACTNDRIFKRLADLMGRPELARDPRFSSERSRVANHLAIDNIVERWANSIDGAKLIEALRHGEIPSSPIYSIAHIFADPQYAARGSLASFVHPRLGEIKCLASFLGFRNRPARSNGSAATSARTPTKRFREPLATAPRASPSCGVKASYELRVW